jgi:hypothetical protein
MYPRVFFIVIILLVSVCGCGEASLIGDAVNVTEFVKDVMCQEYWDGDWTIASEQGKPVKNVKSNKHIRAWIDIIGFKNESIINDTRYVNGSAKAFAIVRRDAWHTPVNGVVVSFTTAYSIDDSMTANATNNETNTTTATQTTNFHWKYKVCTMYGCHWVHVYEGPLTVSSTVPAPENFTTRIPDVCVHIKSYNRTVAPITYIHIPIENHPSMKDVMISRVSYNGSHISRYDQAGWVMKNDRGTEHVEFVDGGVLPSWTKDGNRSVIDHCGRFITVFDPHFNLSLLNISLHTPYETRHISNYSIETVTNNAKVNVPLLKVIALLIISFMMLIIILKVVKRAL